MSEIAPEVQCQCGVIHYGFAIKSRFRKEDHLLIDKFALDALELYDTMSNQERENFKLYLRERIEAGL